MIIRSLVALALCAVLGATEADARGRFEGRTFYFANRTLTTIQCVMYVDNVMEPYVYDFEPNDEHWRNLPPGQTLAIACAGVAGGVRYSHLTPMRRYLFLRRAGAILLYEVTLNAGARSS